MATITKDDFGLARQFIVGDIRREIELAKARHDTTHPERKEHLEAARVQPSGGGNLLAALGLLCYTEFCGWLKFNRSTASGNFNDFFDTLGDGKNYTAFRAKHKVYDIFRCGMVHEYFVKRDFTVDMLDGGGSDIGIAEEGGHYKFNVERYHRDLAAALSKLEAELTFPLTR
jgi:hypothetical protein